MRKIWGDKTSSVHRIESSEMSQMKAISIQHSMWYSKTFLKIASLQLYSIFNMLYEVICHFTKFLRSKLLAVFQLKIVDRYNPKKYVWFHILTVLWKAFIYLRHFRASNSSYRRSYRRKRGFLPSRFPRPYLRVFFRSLYIKFFQNL